MRKLLGTAVSTKTVAERISKGSRAGSGRSLANSAENRKNIVINNNFLQRRTVSA
jgi:hypothetical protein